jgi:uncharacterized OB-fold protein
MSVDTYLEDGELTHRAWSAALREDVLLGQECADCGHVTAAPKAACARCGARDTAVVELPTEGTVYAETTVFVGPAAFTEVEPYDVALIDLDDARVMAHVDGEVGIDDRVTFRGAVEEDDTPAPLFGPTEN